MLRSPLLFQNLVWFAVCLLLILAPGSYLFGIFSCQCIDKQPISTKQIKLQHGNLHYSGQSKVSTNLN